MRQSVHQRHIPVYANQNQEIDAAVDVYLDAHIDDFAHELSERPVELIVNVDGPEGQTGHQNQVGGSQVAQVDLGHGAGLLVEDEDHQDEEVEEDSHNADGQDVDRRSAGQPVPGLRVGTARNVGVVMVAVQRRGVEVRKAAKKHNIQHKLCLILERDIIKFTGFKGHSCILSHFKHLIYILCYKTSSA